MTTGACRPPHLTCLGLCSMAAWKLNGPICAMYVPYHQDGCQETLCTISQRGLAGNIMYHITNRVGIKHYVPYHQEGWQETLCTISPRGLAGNIMYHITKRVNRGRYVPYHQEVRPENVVYHITKRVGGKLYVLYHQEGWQETLCAISPGWLAGHFICHSKTNMKYDVIF